MNSRVDLTINSTTNQWVFKKNGSINLNGHKIAINHNKWMVVATPESRGIWGAGEVTVIGGGNLNISVEAGHETNNGLHIDSVIADYHSVDWWWNGESPDKVSKVGLNVYGAHAGNNVVILGGSESNTFTGGAVVSHKGNAIAVAKTNGAIALRGNIVVQDQAEMQLYESNQFASNSVLTLRSGWLGFLTKTKDKNITNKLSKLVIDKYGVLGFDHELRGNGKRWIYFDDIEFINNGFLEVQGWEYGMDFLLIKKSSKHINDALKKIVFKGYDQSKIHLEDFNEEYWAVVAPEPATYGAALIGVMSVLVFWRRRRK